MVGGIAFTDNFTDLSNEQGYQFEFHCERCGNGYRSAFQHNAASAGQGFLRSAGNLFGGIFQTVSSAADSLAMSRGTNSAAKERALGIAVDQISGQFAQGRGCGEWVCREVCWNDAAGQCVTCAPPVDDEFNLLQAMVRRTQLEEQMAAVDLTKGIDHAAKLRGGCPLCGARMPSDARFCLECGTPAAQAGCCPTCSAELAQGARFCAQSGNAVP